MDQHTNVQARIESLLCSKLEEDEKFVESIEYLQNLNVCGADATERQLRRNLEDRELELNHEYLNAVEKINDQVQSFVDKISQMNAICRNLTDRIQSNKEKTRELLKRTGTLQNEKEELKIKQEYLNNFFEKYSLTEEEEKALLGPKTDGSLPESFFKAFASLQKIVQNAGEQLKLEPDNLTFIEISRSLQQKMENAYSVVHQSVIRECRLLNVEFLDLKPTVHRSLELLQSRPTLFESATSEYGMARRSNVVRAYIDALTKGGKGGMQKSIEQFSNEPLRYVGEMLSWIQGAISAEREILISAVLKSCQPENITAFSKSVLSNISEALCQPLRVRVEQIITKETNCVALYRLSSLFLFYAKNFVSDINADSVLVKVLHDLHELSQHMFFSVVNATVQRITSKMDVPDYDLLPVNAVHQCLLLLRDILESHNDNAFAAVLDRKEMHAKIFAHILDPLLQSIQLVCSNLDNPLDVAVYMLNCMNAIRSVVILHQFSDTRLEGLDMMITANEDVLVSEQASKILSDNELMDIYTRCFAHQTNQGPLARIPGMELERVRNALAMFNEFLSQPDGYQCHQTVKISSARIRESVQKRTFENVLAAYSVIYNKISQTENGYTDLKSLQTLDEVKQSLFK
ncbi:conserved oligomeric complex COG6 domain-containing protein [Ditylenchus destructor]|uniref:Conserved oligomeric Golgi complex subunit 6 n=1 Tax=Ditylenchus destructor TaxID=166010 RepID=A0AAD4N4R1_9BILA|nr:conserved oligomeric complex COG6 domain-containing protein [Ditylenchus destructor]